MTARILRGLTAAQYHADPCDVPSLSSSCGHTLVARSPFHAHLEHPRLGGVRRTDSDAFDHGHLIHSLILEAGRGLEVIRADDYKREAAREARDAARAAGRIPVLRSHYVRAQETAHRIRERIESLGITLDGESETAVTWEEDSAHGPVQCRALFDHAWFDQARALDLKTTRSAHPDAIARSVYEYGYDIQCAAYRSAMRALAPSRAGREDFLFLFVEEFENAPKEVVITPARLDAVFLDLGERRWRRAVEAWARCTAANDWPPYAVTQAVQLEAPRYALFKEELAS